MRAENHFRPHGRIIESHFRPHPLLRGAHAQTLGASLLRPLPRLYIRRERLELSDGDFVDLGWCGEGSGPIVVLVHGLTGSFDSKYLRGTARRLLAKGWRCVLLQLRGAGPEPNRSTRYYNHGDTADLRHLWHLLRQREPATPLYSIGWSLGANVTLKALAEEGHEAPVRATAVACAPFQLTVCADRLRQGFSKVYQKRLLDELKASLRRKHARLAPPAGVDLAAALQAQDFYQFDDAYTAPLNAYRNALDYYQRCSSAQFLRAIQVPTLIVNALDDPFMTPELIPAETDLAPSVTLELSQHGGHVGYIGASRTGQPEAWLEWRLSETLAAQHAGQLVVRQ